MRSFDLFGTLIAGAATNIPDGDQEHHFPIAENIAKVQPGDIVVSDYYDEAKALRLLRDVAGLTNRLIVSEDGKRSGRIWRLLPGVTEHLGDNQHSDVDSPTRAGIKGIRTDLAKWSKNENALLNVLPNLAKTMRATRLRTWDADPLQRQRQLLQIQANYPLLYCASLLLHRQLKDETVLMSSRDCYLWTSLLFWIAQQTNAKYRPTYWYTSRLCRESPSPAYLEGLAELLTNAVIVDVAGTGRSLSRLLDRVGKPDTPIYLLYQYNQRFMEQAYGPAKLGNIKTFLPNIQGANLERANMARHAMILDSTQDNKPITVFNPCNIDWLSMPEIKVQHEAFGFCLDAARFYPLDLEATDKQLQDAMFTCCGWIREYDLAMAFATKFLKDEDAAVMQRLKCAK
jgi:hypothetical protein